MMSVFLDILKTPLLWQSLGLITAISLFISPVLYNGDYKIASKSLIILGGYAIFSSMLIILHIKYIVGCGIKYWIRPISFLGLVALAYSFGLVLGIYIHNKSKKILIK